MPKGQLCWTAAEELMMLPYLKKNQRWQDIAHLFRGRTRGAVQAKWFDMRDNGPRKVDANYQVREEDCFSANQLQDKAFQEAMRRAIAAGLEKMPEPAPLDLEPSKPKRFKAPFIWRSYGSPAADCAALGAASDDYASL